MSIYRWTTRSSSYEDFKNNKVNRHSPLEASRLETGPIIRNFIKQVLFFTGKTLLHRLFYLQHICSQSALRDFAYGPPISRQHLHVDFVD